MKKKNKLDVLTYKNTKFLFYRFNDLLNQSCRTIKVVKLQLSMIILLLNKFKIKIGNILLNKF